MFRSGERTFRSGERTFRSGELTFRIAEHRMKAYLHTYWIAYYANFISVVNVPLQLFTIRQPDRGTWWQVVVS